MTAIISCDSLCNFCIFYIFMKGWFLTIGPQTYMRLVFPIQSEFLLFHGATRHTSFAHCRTRVHPYHGDARHLTTMNPGPLSHPAPHAHDERPLDLALRVVRFPAPLTSHTQTTLASRIYTRNWRIIGAQRRTGYTHAMPITRHRC